MKYFEQACYFAVLVFAESLSIGSSIGLNQNDTVDNFQPLCQNTYNYVASDDPDDPDKVPYDIIYFENPPRFEACNKKLKFFAAASANFTYCIVTYARPIKICEMCVHHYKVAKDAYSDITDNADGNGCRKVLLRSDRVQIIEHIAMQTATLWATSNCENCFNSDHRISNDTATFNLLRMKTEKCIMEFNCTLYPSGVSGNSSDCHAEACHNCSSDYKKLNKFYKELVSRYTMENMCMDIVDMMNTTRKIWSKGLKCVKYNNDIFVLFTLVTFVCLFPIFFYCGSWIQSDEQKSKIVPQKRLASSRSAAHLSSIN